MILRSHSQQKVISGVGTVEDLHRRLDGIRLGTLQPGSSIESCSYPPTKTT